MPPGQCRDQTFAWLWGCPRGAAPDSPPRPGQIRLCRSDQRQRARPKAARQASRRPVRAEASNSTGNLWFPVEGLDELVLVLGAEVGLDDLGVPEHVGGRTVGHDPAPVEGDEVVGEATDER